MGLARSWYEAQNTTIKAATERLNKILGTRYDQARVGQWINEKRHLPDHIRLFMLQDALQDIAEKAGIKMSDKQSKELINKIK